MNLWTIDGCGMQEESADSPAIRPLLRGREWIPDQVSDVRLVASDELGTDGAGGGAGTQCGDSVRGYRTMCMARAASEMEPESEG
jgi:hypothetical protein